MEKYILEGTTPVVEKDLMKWAEWMETGKRVIHQDKLNKVTISTVFLGLDHQFGSDGPPLLFETMIFGGEHNDYQERCSTYDDAELQHEHAVQLVTESFYM